MAKSPRRVVTGHDKNGRSIVVSDEAVPAKRAVARRAAAWYDIWNTTAMPAPISSTEPDPALAPYKTPPEPNGTCIRIAEYGPGIHERERFVHRTETIDYAIVLEGECVLRLDDGAEVVLGTGDVVVQRGTNHAWINRSSGTLRMAYILIDGSFSQELAEKLGPDALAHVVRGPPTAAENR
jgi:hypothetical protein